jgi:hypothetical protein
MESKSGAFYFASFFVISVCSTFQIMRHLKKEEERSSLGPLNLLTAVNDRRA